MPSNDPRPTKAERRDQAREQARAMREQQLKREKRNRLLAISGLVAAVVVLAVVVVLILRPGPATPGVAFTGDDGITLADTTAPAAANANGGIPVGQDGVAGTPAADGDVVVSVYLDYMCPYCGQFEKANDSELTSLREEGGVTVEYHLLAFLDAQSKGTHYSTRAGNAAAIVADQAPEAFAAFSSALFANQPEEGTEGLTDDEIADLATEAGVPSAVVDTFTATVSEDDDWRTFAPWLAANNNQAATDLGKISTPTVLIDGTQFEGDLYNAGPLREAVEAAKG